MADTNTSLSNSHIALLVLSLIAEEPTYGYRIIKELEARSENYFQMKEGSLYPVLHQLEKDGLVRTEWRVQKGTPNRRYYTITKRGNAALQEAKSDFETRTKAMRLVMQMQ
jgi:PadR family transcriptional regulator, regulatory protein PadR